MTPTKLMAGAATAALVTTHAMAQDDGTQTPVLQLVPGTSDTYVLAPEGADLRGLEEALRTIAERAAAGTEEVDLQLAEGGDAIPAGPGVSTALTADAAQALVDEGGVPGGADASDGGSEMAMGAQEATIDGDAELAPGEGGFSTTAGVIAEGDGTVVRAGQRLETAQDDAEGDVGLPADDTEMAAEGGASEDGSLTQVNPDLGELARAADGAFMGVTEGAAQVPAAGDVPFDLDGFGEMAFERGFQSGYVRGVRDAQARMQEAMASRQERMNRLARAARLQRMQEMSRDIEAEQRQMLGLTRQQAERGRGMPRVIVVPQGTDVTALMRELQRMNQGG